MKRGDAILQIIAVEVSNSNHGDFLKNIAAAWQRAEPDNKRILRPTWLVLIEKYKLNTEYVEAIERELPSYLDSERYGTKDVQSI